MGLVFENGYDDLPEDNDQCFVEFESKCRSDMNKALGREQSGEYFVLIRSQYMAAVYAVAQECGIINLPDPESAPGNYDDNQEFFNRFSSVVQGEVARIRVRGRRGRAAFSVLLAPNTRSKIE